METNNKIKSNIHDLLVENHEAVSAALKKSVRKAVLRHQMTGTPVVVSRNGEIIELQKNGVFDVWNNDEDDVYAELMDK